VRDDELRPDADEIAEGGLDYPLRRGNTVRRPAAANTEFVQRLLLHLEAAGVTWSPRALGLDEQGREVVSWLPGCAASVGADVDLAELTRIVRDLHDLTASLVEGSACVVHDDLQPRNVIVDQTRPVGLIDWEQARPGRRVEDVANLCWSFIEPTPGSDPEEVAQKWRQIVQGYGLDNPEELVPTVLSRMTTCAEDIERNAALGSARHRRLANLGHDRAIRAMHDWTTSHRRSLEAVIAPR